MGSANAVRLALAKESVFGTNPGDGNFSYQRIATQTFRIATQEDEDDELDADRQPPGSTRVSENAVGGFTCADSLLAPVPIAGGTQNGYDLVIEGAMMSAWGTQIALVAQDIDISGVAGGTFTLTDAAAAGAFTNAVKGQWLRLGGFDTNTGSVYAHITTKTSNDVVVCEGFRLLADRTTAAVVNESGQVDIVVEGSMIRIGTTLNSYTAQIEYTDLAVPGFSLATGLAVGTWDWAVTNQQKMRNTFGFLGQLFRTTTANAAGTVLAKWATPILRAPYNLLLKMEGSFEQNYAGRISDLSYRLDNRNRLEYEVGSSTPALVLDRPSVTGSIGVYHDDVALQQKIELETYSKLAFLLGHISVSGRRMVTFPRIKYTPGGADARGRGQSVVQEAPFVAEKDADGVTMQIDRFVGS